MSDDVVTTGALFFGGSLAGYALGRWVIARTVDAKAHSPATTTSAAEAAPPPSTEAPVTAPAPQARTASHSRTRPRHTPTQRTDEPVSSPDQIEHPAAPPTDEPVSSPSQVEHQGAQPASFTTGSAKYDARAARLIASIPRRVARTRELIAQWPTYLDRYRGGLPRSVFAAVMQMESNGRVGVKGDAALGEVGLFQVTEAFPRSLGLDPKLRYDTEWNFYFAGAEYNQAAMRWNRRYRSLIVEGSKDAWLLSRVSFAIGDGAARAHVERAVRAHREIAERDGVYAALATLVRDGGARKAGSQSAAKVAYRIAVVCPVNFDIGEQAEPGQYGPPINLATPASPRRSP